jgi:hypothetical protein
MTRPSFLPRQLVLLLLVVLGSGCAQPDSGARKTVTAPQPKHTHVKQQRPVKIVAKPVSKPKRRPKPRKSAKPSPRPTRSAKPPRFASCPPPGNVLLGVYHPERLIVVDSCQHASGVVADVRTEEDGDLHVLVRLDLGFRYLVNRQNRLQQHGWLVVELTPRDHGHLPAPGIDAHIGLLGAWVTDTEHGWKEIHPVWQETLNGRTFASGPYAGGSPPYDRSADALAGCRTGAGTRCTGYGGESSAQPSDSGGAADEGGSSGGPCTPGYKPCLAPYSDYDCVGGGGDGPRYVQGPVYVTGSDPYNLDSDGDGVACQS